MNLPTLLLAAFGDNTQQPSGFPLWGVALIVLVFFGAVVVIVAFNYGNIWLRAYFSRANVTLLSLIGMSFRRVNKLIIVQGKVMAMQSGIGLESETGVTTRRLEAHFLAGGDVLKVIRSIIAAIGPTSTWISTAPPPSTSPAATCWRPCKPASIPR